MRIFGLITLLIFPLPVFIAFWLTKHSIPYDWFKFAKIVSPASYLGLSWGVIYAVGSLYISQWFNISQEMKKQELLVKSLNLTLLDCIFLAFCAGFGEELLFRIGIQSIAGISITSIGFVAIHGYLNPFKWRMAIYGLILLPFIFSLAYAVNFFGIWFCISAHMGYDLLLFLAIKYEK